MQILESSHTIGSFNIFVYSLNHTFGVFAISESWLIPHPPPPPPPPTKTFMESWGTHMLVLSQRTELEVGCNLTLELSVLNFSLTKC